MEPVGPDANTIVGLLADPDRRRLLAALELGAATLHDAAAAADMPLPHAARVLGKLVDGGLVDTDGKGAFTVVGGVFSRAARAALARRPSDEHAGEPSERRKVLDMFVRDGRITSMPTATAKRRILLDWLAGRFEVGRHYSEAEINVLLDGHAEDHVSLRRALVDGGFLDRDERVYWRSGGTVE
jgi:hypothetical protein